MVDYWTPNQRKFIEWLSTPRFNRAPPTKELLAQELRVGVATLYRWQKLDGFQDAVTARAEEMIGSKLPDVYGALIAKAEAQDVAAIKLILELTGRYTPTQKVEQTGEVLISIDK